MSYKLAAAVIIALLIIFALPPRISMQDIKDTTDKWVDAVAIENNPSKVKQLFCRQVVLSGTISKQQGKPDYFDVFAKLPGLKTVERSYEVEHVAPNTWISTAYIMWIWDGQATPLATKLTFTFTGKCVSALHTADLPNINVITKTN